MVRQLDHLISPPTWQFRWTEVTGKVRYIWLLKATASIPGTNYGATWEQSSLPGNYSLSALGESIFDLQAVVLWILTLECIWFITQIQFHYTHSLQLLPSGLSWPHWKHNLDEAGHKPCTNSWAGTRWHLVLLLQAHSLLRCIGSTYIAYNLPCLSGLVRSKANGWASTLASFKGCWNPAVSPLN